MRTPLPRCRSAGVGRLNKWPRFCPSDQASAPGPLERTSTPMARHKRDTTPLSRRDVPETVLARLRPPLAVVLGSPAEVVNLLSACPTSEATCYQMDLYQSERLQEELGGRGLAAKVATRTSRPVSVLSGAPAGRSWTPGPPP